MKTIICSIMFLFILSCTLVSSASEEDAQRSNVSVKPMLHSEDSEIEKEIAESLPPGEKIKQTPRYKARLRDLQRAYETGEFTKTEYIQRRRELAAISEKVKE